MRRTAAEAHGGHETHQAHEPGGLRTPKRRERPEEGMGEPLGARTALRRTGVPGRGGAAGGPRGGQNLMLLIMPATLLVSWVMVGAMEELAR